MKAIQDIKNKVEIISYGGAWWWTVCTKEWDIVGNKEYKHKQSAINNWKKFAELNGITNYKIIGE